MAIDFFAVVSIGIFPTPTPTATQRAAYAVSYGLLSLVPAGIPGGGMLGKLVRFIRRRGRR